MTDQQFPKFETYREQIDGKYWFPTYTIANRRSTSRTDRRVIKLTVKYEDYKQFKSETNDHVRRRGGSDGTAERSEETVSSFQRSKRPYSFT